MALSTGRRKHLAQPDTLPPVTNRTLGTMLALSIVLAGCTSDEKKPTVLPPAPSASPSAVAPSPPVEAMVDTPQGAAAFARFYFEDVISEAYKTLDTTTIIALSEPQCNSCRNVASDVQRLRDLQYRVPGERFIIQFAEAAPTGSGENVIVDIRFSADPYQEIDKSGVIVREVAARSSRDAQVALKRSGSGWRVAGIRMVEA